MRYTKEHIENRIKKLENNPVENENLIRKWKRILRKMDN